MTLLGFFGRQPPHDGMAPVGALSESCRFGRAPSCVSDAQLSVLVSGRPRLDANELVGPHATSAEIVRFAYRKYGRMVFLERLRGPFAVVVLDHEDTSAVLAVDRMGIERLAYAVADDTLVFSTSAELVANAACISAEICPQAIYDYLFLHMVPAPRTIFSGVQKLPPATAAVYCAGRVSTFRYWSPKFATESAPSFEALRDQLRADLERAVRHCAPDDRTGAFLSGGLDSSTVVGLLGNVLGAAAPTFSIGFGNNTYDELRYARIANRHFACRPHEYQLSAADVVRVFPKIAEAYDEPFGNSSAAPTFLCAEVARSHGVDHLLAGDGGDELFAGNERYAKQLLFEAYGRIPAWARRRLVEPLADATPSDTWLTPVRKLRSFVQQARIPLPQRLESWNFVARTNQAEMLHPDFADGIDPAITAELMQEVWESAPSSSALERLLYYDWYFTLASNDLRKVGTMCELAGVRASYPMLDEAVVDLAVRIPDAMRMRRLELRSFYKKAMRGFLPEEILKKTKHGFGLPFSAWLHADRRLGDLISDYLSELRHRRIIRSEFIDDLIRRHAMEPSSYLGYPIWNLAMLSAWLIAHDARRVNCPRKSESA